MRLHQSFCAVFAGLEGFGFEGGTVWDRRWAVANDAMKMLRSSSAPAPLVVHRQGGDICSDALLVDGMRP